MAVWTVKTHKATAMTVRTILVWRSMTVSPWSGQAFGGWINDLFVSFPAYLYIVWRRVPGAYSFGSTQMFTTADLPEERTASRAR